MPASGLRLKGDKALIRTLDRMKASAARRVIRPAVNAGLTPLNKAAKRTVPVDKKLLKRSLGKKVKLYGRTGVIFGAVGPRTGFRLIVNGKPVDPTKYGHVVEHRTRFLTRAFDESKATMMSALTRKVREGIVKLAKKK